MEPVQNEKGEWVIPASRRPDGTWRKEKVMKEGYVPQDEIRAFATRASANKSVKKGIPGLAPPVVKLPTKPSVQHSKSSSGSITSTTSTMANLKMSDLSVGDKVISSSTVFTCVPVVTTLTAPAAVVVAPVNPKVEAAKKVKALRKKLRDIEEIALKSKEELTPEQVEKLSRRSEIEAEIERWAAV